MITERNQLFRKSALERLSSPDRLDERLILVSYRPWVRFALPVLLALIAFYAFWTVEIL
jgi:hypothetical protein